MEFYQTAAGKQFFSGQLPRLISALTDIAAALKTPTPVFRLEQELPPDFLKNLYYGALDPMEQDDPGVFRDCNAAILAHQERMRDALSSEDWEWVEKYRTLLDARGAVEREQAFAAGFQYATRMFTAGLSVPRMAKKTS